MLPSIWWQKKVKTKNEQKLFKLNERGFLKKKRPSENYQHVAEDLDIR